MRHLVMGLLGLGGAGLLALAVLWPVQPAFVPEMKAAKGSGPNVVFILVDTLRADMLTPERDGRPLMPRLSAIAAEGMRFTQAISPASWTRPAIASLFSGQHVDTHQVYFGISPDTEGGKADVLPQDWHTLAEAMRAAGYDNHAWFTNGHLNDDGFRQGVDAAQYHYMPEARAREITDAALAGLARASTRFFAYVHYIDPHAPYDPPAAYKDAPAPGITPRDEAVLQHDAQIPYLVLAVRKALGQGLAQQLEPVSAAGEKTLFQWYLGECRYVDDEVARLIEGIRRAHPDTIFVFTADHGEEFWEHGAMGHGTTLYQEQIHVPLFLVGPGIAPGQVDAPVETLSIYKTLAARLGLKTERPLQGRDLLAAGEDSAAAFSRTRGPSTDLEVNLEAVLLEKQKLITNPANASQAAAYDLRADPGERAPLAPEGYPALNSALEELRKHNTARPGRIQRQQVEVSDELRETLQGLGYVH
jgi:arylsulfatase A-like enzyme